MDRYNAIALYWLIMHKAEPPVDSLEGYIRQFDEIVLQIRGVDENLKRSEAPREQ